MDVEEGTAVDRISSLPRNVIDIILRCLPIRDAARTSTLSSKWRNVFADYPRLVFDKQFCEEIKRNRSPTQYQNDFVNIVYRILLQHLGPILEFVLDISYLNPEQYSEIDQWMRFLSRKGVQQLTVDNSHHKPYKIPPCFFSSPELTHLRASHCILKAPNAFKGFRKLNVLILTKVHIQSLVLTAPLLVTLQLEECSGTRDFGIHAPMLKRLVLEDNDDLNLSHYMICENISVAYLSLPNEVKHHGGKGSRTTLMELLGCWPKLSELLLDKYTLKLLAVESVPKELPNTLNHLRRLAPFRINFALDQIALILCLLRSSPVLLKLELWICTDVSNNNDDVDVVNYLNEQDCKNQRIVGLHTVQMKNFKGSRAELHFVKLLLASSPSLENMFIDAIKWPNGKNSEQWEVARELMRFSRASPKAEIIFQANKN